MDCNERLEYLKNINEEIRALEDSLLVVRTRLTKITPVLSDMPGCRTVESDDKLVFGVAKIIELEAAYKEKILILASYEKICLEIISGIESSILRIILIERYINGKDFQTIADIFPYSYNHVCKLHAQALDEYSESYTKMIQNTNDDKS